MVSSHASGSNAKHEDIVGKNPRFLPYVDLTASTAMQVVVLMLFLLHCRGNKLTWLVTSWPSSWCLAAH